MKKLMITAAIVCAAAMSQAATYNWQASSAFVIRGEEGESDPSAWAGNAVYFFDANVYAQDAFIASLANGTEGFANAFSTTGNIGSWGDFSFGVEEGGTLTANGGYASGYAVMLDTDSIATAKNVYIINYDDVEIIAAHDSGSQVAFADNVGTITGDVGGAGWYSVASVPEPTSGLLLLLGVAGLALRRRRA